MFPLLPMVYIASLWHFHNFILPFWLFFPFCYFSLYMYVHPSYCPFTNTSFSLFVYHPSFATVPIFIHFAPPVHHLSPQALKWREYRRKNPLGMERGKDGPHSFSCALETKRPGTRVMRRNVFDFPPTNQPLSFGRLNGAEPISNTQQGLKGMSRKGGWGWVILFVVSKCS